MDKGEELKRPELKTEELLRVIKDIKWEDNFLFYFDGIPFRIFITSAEDLANDKTGKFGGRAEYYGSTVNSGFDIYLHDTIPEDERERILFHEIAEACLNNQQFKSSEAHEMVLAEEEKVFGEREAQKEKDKK